MCNLQEHILSTAYFSISGQHPDPCYLRDVWVPAAEARPPARPPAQLPPLHSSLGPRRPCHDTLHPLRVQVSNRSTDNYLNHGIKLPNSMFELFTFVLYNLDG